MSSVFISYSRKDERFARQLATALSNRGFDVWIDVEDIPAGMKWSSAIQQGLDQADAMVVVISPDSMASTNVEDEWQYFLDQRKPVFPVLLRQAKVHFQLSRIQYVDFLNATFEDGFSALQGQLLAKGITPGDPPPVAKPLITGLPWWQRVPRWLWGMLALGLLALVMALVAPAILPSAPTTPGESSATVPPSLTATRTRRPVLSPDQLTATEQAAIQQAETELALTDVAGTVAANAPAATLAAGQTATADALTATADTFTETPTPNRLQTLAAGRATQTAVAGLTQTVVALTPTPVCAGADEPLLILGEPGRIAAGVDPRPVHQSPSTGADQITTLPAGTAVLVIDGPLCDQDNGVLWWHVRWDAGDGWIVESQAGERFVNPA